jgi:hypothetical protein
MNMAGFTAEAAVYRARGDYQMHMAGPGALSSIKVVPQIAPWCRAACHFCRAYKDNPFACWVCDNCVDWA